MAFTADTGDHKVTRSDIFLVDPEVRCKAIEHAMILFRASGPCVKDEVRREILVQTVGVTAENVDEVTEFVWDLLIRVKAIEPYDDDGAYDVRA